MEARPSTAPAHTALPGAWGWAPDPSPAKTAGHGASTQPPQGPQQFRCAFSTPRETRQAGPEKPHDALCGSQASGVSVCASRCRSLVGCRPRPSGPGAEGEPSGCGCPGRGFLPTKPVPRGVTLSIKCTHWLPRTRRALAQIPSTPVPWIWPCQEGIPEARCP